MSCPAQLDSALHCITAAAGADGDGQPLRSYDDIPLNALSAIHDILMCVGKDEAGFCAQHRDAAVFRSTCKTFHDAASWPGVLKLAFHKSPRQGTWNSLATMLSQPSAASTQLSLRLCIPESGLEGGAALRAAASALGDWVLSLEPLSPRVLCLEMPAIAGVDNSIAAACFVLPSMSELVLHCSADTDTFDSSLSFSGCNLLWEHAREAGGQLRSVTLTVPPGQPPFVICREDGLLDLSGLPSLEHVLLSGPIVKDDDIDEDECPFKLPLHVKVTITPGLEGREHTRWARTQSTYNSCDVGLGRAIPIDPQYMEEDQGMRDERIASFVDVMTEMAVETIENTPDPSWEVIREKIVDWKNPLRMQIAQNLQKEMEKKGVEGRSDLLQDVVDIDDLTEWSLARFEETCGMMYEAAMYG